MTVGVIVLTSPPVRSDSTSAGSCCCDISRAAAVRRRTGPTTAFETNHIRPSVSSMANTAAPPYLRTSLSAAEAAAFDAALMVPSTAVMALSTLPACDW